VLGCLSLSREAPSASCVMGAWQAWRRLPVGMVVTRPQFKDLQLINVAGSASWLVLIFGLFAFGGMAGSLIDWIDWDMPAHQQGTGSASQLVLCLNLSRRVGLPHGGVLLVAPLRPYCSCLAILNSYFAPHLGLNLVCVITGLPIHGMGV